MDAAITERVVRGGGFDAVFASCDLVAVHAIGALAAPGLRLPAVPVARPGLKGPA